VQADSSVWATSLWKSRFGPATQLTPHHHDEPTLCLVVAGAYRERIRGRETEHGGGHLLFCPAFETHSQTFETSGAVKVLLRPTEQAIAYLKEHVRLPDAPFAHSRDLAAIGYRLTSELNGPDEFSGVIIEGLVGEMLGLFARSGRSRAASGLQFVNAARDFIVEHACAGFTTAQLAAAVPHDPGALNQAFRQVFGKSVGEYARQVRLDRALELITRTRTPIAEISAECGFHDQAHFTRTFSAAYGVTPGRYRRVGQ
jgi:AraC family transcriptional regulator